MATKKAVKKAVKKTTAKKTETKAKAPKAEKTTETKSKSAAPPKVKTQSKMVLKGSLTTAQQNLITKADKLEVAIQDQKDALENVLHDLNDALGGASSFEHPERGPMTIMFRQHWYWRSKPAGAPKK